MPLPKFKIVIKDHDYFFKNILIVEATDIGWTYFHLIWERSWTVFDNPIRRAEALLSIIYAHPNCFRIRERLDDGSIYISKLSDPHEFEVIDERTEPEPPSKGEWVYDMAHGTYELIAVINPTLLGD